jgi:menaquinone-dependent protoporphyrinogen IX oxidase
MKRRTFLGACASGALVLTQKANALEYYPQASDKKWAILFGTWYGTTRDASLWISEGMGGIAQVFDIRENPDLTAYDHLVIGTAIQAGKGPQQLEDYLKKHLPTLKDKIKGIFAVCGALGKKPGEFQQENYIDKYLAKLCEFKSGPSHVFGGRITKELLSSEHTEQLAGFFKQMDVPFENYDNLSRLECMEFGKKIFQQVHGSKE